MKTYKLGNKINCIIRSCCPGHIGSQEMSYSYQPYTILKNVEASLTFAENTRKAKSVFTDLHFSQDILQEINISNVEINDKILNLIFLKNEDKLCSTFENCYAEDNKIYISAPTEEIYDVFIYNTNGELEKVFETLNSLEVEVDKNEDYLVFYSYAGGKTYDLKNIPSQYLSLDLIIEGNADDELNTSYIHVDKCALQVNKNMHFNRTLNAVDLKFTVISSGENYINLE